MNTHLYVNKGVGFGSLRFRYGVRPEVAMITLTLHPLLRPRLT